MSYIIASKILDTDYDSCIIVFNRFISTTVQRPVQYEINSFSLFCLNVFSIKRNQDIILDTLRLKTKYDSFFLLELYHFNIVLLLLDALEELEYCELAARANAMDQAVKNIAEIIKGLRDLYNKARQAYITNEILEIISAAEHI